MIYFFLFGIHTKKYYGLLPVWSLEFTSGNDQSYLKPVLLHNSSLLSYLSSSWTTVTFLFWLVWVWFGLGVLFYFIFRATPKGAQELHWDWLYPRQAPYSLCYLSGPQWDCFLRHRQQSILERRGKKLPIIKYISISTTGKKYTKLGK